MEEDDDDPVVQEVDIFLSKALTERLYLFQYPVRPATMPYDEVEVIGVRMKPKQQKVELELGINTRSVNYSHSKGEQIALNVDGASRGSESAYFASGIMDKQLLVSSSVGNASLQYAAAVFRDDELHLTPVQGVIQLKPNFNYFDKADSKMKESTADDGESSQEEDEAKPVMVKFARAESEAARAKRMQSYEYLQQQKTKEAWLDLNYHTINAELSEMEREQLCSRKTEVEASELHLNQRQYLALLTPELAKDASVKPALPNNVLSMTQLKTMPMGDQIKALLLNAKVIRFTQLIQLLPRDTDPMSILRSLQQVAVLVQGCWVVKSEILYPKDTFSSHSGVSAEILCRARNFVMWKFTQNRSVTRREITSVIKVSQ
ncbi:PREDICTED: DNA-directed RNA polymerase III subunit RPC5-like [Priapulus caudatus]|uniref:DNA-directed RNA polymerase III subunit RPC5-like n=1 Tax=Priapulus caudatus TaxID=37621 RepID=A0ABM1EAQ0_PRICU|nr:PREDICTED: DNA-directed RNA polymerase III subunit RPC5-like [Priapulus caudatus]